jgi:hypothetical protein
LLPTTTQHNAQEKHNPPLANPTQSSLESWRKVWFDNFQSVRFGLNPLNRTIVGKVVHSDEVHFHRKERKRRKEEIILIIFFFFISGQYSTGLFDATGALEGHPSSQVVRNQKEQEAPPAQLIFLIEPLD